MTVARVTFTETGTFEASRKAEAWCAARGLSLGPSDRFGQRGILLGNYCIAKWHNLTKQEIAQLDGVLTGDGRHGPVHIDLKDDVFARVEAAAEISEVATPAKTARKEA
ncbi:MAG: hypothetical protein BGO50_01360 [Rhodanobacter sp. 67-28]|nr:MAG: hypothetical protein BGO50_01360 [Rhodanobacter sp. 67-28]